MRGLEYVDGAHAPAAKRGQIAAGELPDLVADAAAVQILHTGDMEYLDWCG